MHLFVFAVAAVHVFLFFEESRKLITHCPHSRVLSFIVTLAALHVFVLLEEPNERGIEKNLLGLAIGGDVERVTARTKLCEKLFGFSFGPHAMPLT